MTPVKSTFIESRSTWFLLALLVITFIPFLGLTDFYTKGEPREAVVALSMLKSGDWVLPVSNGTDIPYKPPMLAWIIACFSWVAGGVTEFTSRLPSALAVIIMTMAGYRYCRRYRGAREAMLMALITVTSFEVHRAGTNCRVDMLLTMFMVTAIYRMFDSFQRRGSILSIVSVLLLSGGVLTKGPVGAILPLGVMWVFMLIRGAGLWRATWQCALMFVGSLLIPALWYWAAYQRGGKEFLDLAMEENIGRFTGTMSYESHVNPWYYNVITVISGMAPYTLLLLIGAPLLIRGYRRKTAFSFDAIRRTDPWVLLMWVTVLLIFIFYCIPSSKRSVYLLPIYPMLAYGTGRFIMALWKRGQTALNIYSCLIAVLAVVTPLLFTALAIFYTPDVATKTGRTIAGMQQYAASAPVAVYMTFIVSIAAGIMLLQNLRHHNRTAFMLFATLAIYWSFSAVYQPAALRSKSNTAVIASVSQYPELYSWCEDSMLRFYSIDFALGDRITPLRSLPDREILFLVGDRDFEAMKGRYEAGFTFETVTDYQEKSCDVGQRILLVKSKPKTL